MAEEEKKVEESQEQSQDTFGFVKSKLSSLFSKATSVASEVGNNVYENVKETYEKGKDIVDEKIRENEADKVFTKLGRNVYKLVLRNEIQLPESCDKYIEAIKDIYGENDIDVSTEIHACDEKKCVEGECCCDKDECCEEKNDEQA